MKLEVASGVTFLSLSCLLAQPKDARACGGCFHPEQAGAMSTVVTAHRMAFATSGTRTVLWDQIRYTGNPTDFSWVLPIKGDVKLEAATDAWFESLETVTNTRVSPPPLNCFYQSSGGGCSCGGDDSASVPTRSGGGFNGGDVVVTHEGSVGPYDFVQVAGGGEALSEWLPQNGYAVPSDIEPVLAAYATEGFGFIALKLQPGMQTKQMTPVRVITAGGGNTLPLRMVAAGTGDFVAITLYVIAEGRYDVDGFADAKIDASKLTWDWASSQSNYATVRQQAFDAFGGKAWMTSFSQLKAFTRTYNDALGQPLGFSVVTGTTGGSLGQSFNNLADLYFAQAKSNANQPNACPMSVATGQLDSAKLVYDNCKDAVPTSDGGVPAPDAGSLPPSSTSCDVSQPPAGTIPASTLACDGFSDIAAAMIGMHPDTVWVTRLESNLPRASLAGDLMIKPATSQSAVDNAVRAAVHVNPPCDLLENHPEVTTLTHRSEQAGVGVLSGMGLFFARRLRRRRGRVG